MEEIVLFQHMELSQQFRLCGLAYEHWGEVSRESEGQTKYKIRLPNNLVTDRYLPVLYGTIDYVTPALNCHIIDDSRNQDTRYSVVPNPGDEYSVLLADSREIDQEDADPVIKILTLKNNLTNVSCLYENDDLFHEITYLDYLRRIVRRLLFPSQ